MTNLVSISIKSCKSLAGAIMHNRDHKKLDYVNSDLPIHTIESREITNLSKGEVYQYERKQIQELNALIKEKTGRSSQVKHHYLDGLISLGRDQFIQLNQEQLKQLEKRTIEFVQKEIADKYNTKIKHISFHYDEGHRDENGIWQSNAHIHFTVENVNRDTGKSIQRTLTKQSLKELQTKVGDYYQDLGFVRGKDYSANSEQPPKQVYWKDYKRQKEQKTKEILIEKKEFYKSDNLYLENKIDELEKQYKQARQELKDSKEAKQVDYQNLKKDFERQKLELSQEQSRNINLSLENTSLKHENESLKSEILKVNIEKSEMDEENNELKIENKGLLSAIERFLSLSSINPLNSISKSILERLNTVFEYFENQVTRKEQKIEFKTNQEVLDYYRKFSPDLVAKIEREKIVEVPVLNYEPRILQIENKHNPDYVCSTDELLEALAELTKHHNPNLSTQSIKSTERIFQR